MLIHRIELGWTTVTDETTRGAARTHNMNHTVMEDRSRESAERAAVREIKSVTTNSEVPVRFFLYFGSRKSAEAAATAISRELEINPKVDRSTSGEDWVLLVHTKAEVNTLAFDYLSTKLEEIAGQFGGEFDGWEAGVE